MPSKIKMTCLFIIAISFKTYIIAPHLNVVALNGTTKDCFCCYCTRRCFSCCWLSNALRCICSVCNRIAAGFAIAVVTCGVFVVLLFLFPTACMQEAEENESSKQYNNYKWENIEN